MSSRLAHAIHIFYFHRSLSTGLLPAEVGRRVHILLQFLPHVETFNQTVTNIAIFAKVSIHQCKPVLLQRTQLLLPRQVPLLLHIDRVEGFFEPCNDSARAFKLV